jgi:F-type H+-transporting ATPase subunit epsilon
MADKLTLDIVTPYGLVFTDQVDEIVAAGSEGEFGVLPHHARFLTTLKVGMLTYKKGSETGYIFLSGGYAEVGPDKVVILADSATKAADIDIERALSAKKRAEERLNQQNQFDKARATAALNRAVERIHIAEKTK